MSVKTPPEVTEAGAQVGSVKSHTPWDKLLVAGFLGGAYIAFGGLLAIVASAGMSKENGLAFLGNLVGAAIFVGGFYWYLYGRPEEGAAVVTPPGDEPPVAGRRFVRAGERTQEGAHLR